MRIILIIQSLIILAGAYYVYTLTRVTEDPVLEDESSSNIEIEVRREDGSTTDAEDENNTSTATDDESIMIEGANDLGMEFPMPDDGELESR